MRHLAGTKSCAAIQYPLTGRIFSKRIFHTKARMIVTKRTSLTVTFQCWAISTISAADYDAVETPFRKDDGHRRNWWESFRVSTRLRDDHPKIHIWNMLCYDNNERERKLIKTFDCVKDKSNGQPGVHPRRPLQIPKPKTANRTCFYRSLIPLISYSRTLLSTLIPLSRDAAQSAEDLATKIRVYRAP